MNEWLQLALRPDITGRGLKVALIVGTILAVINHGDIVASGAFTVGVLGKILLTYCVPYCVSTYVSVEALANQRQSQK